MWVVEQCGEILQVNYQFGLESVKVYDIMNIVGQYCQWQVDGEVVGKVKDNDRDNLQIEVQFIKCWFGDGFGYQVLLDFDNQFLLLLCCWWKSSFFFGILVVGELLYLFGVIYKRNIYVFFVG